jgi:hypothetical protein
VSCWPTSTPTAFQRTHRGDQPADQEDQAGRARLPQFDNYRLRLLLHCGVEWHTPDAIPDQRSPTTLRCVEPNFDAIRGPSPATLKAMGRTGTTLWTSGDPVVSCQRPAAELVAHHLLRPPLAPALQITGSGSMDAATAAYRTIDTDTLGATMNVTQTGVLRLGRWLRPHPTGSSSNFSDESPTPRPDQRGQIGQ